MKTAVISTLLLVGSIISGYAQQESTHNASLDYFVGKWLNKSVNQITNEVTYGESQFYWEIGEKWLHWSFKMHGAKDTLEILTLIRYNKHKNVFAFYSFNLADEEPTPHFRNWIESNKLRIENDFQDVNVCVYFSIINDKEFLQEHSKLNDKGERIKTWNTYYTRKTY